VATQASSDACKGFLCSQRIYGMVGHSRGVGFDSLCEMGLCFVSSEVYQFSPNYCLIVEITILKMTLILCTSWERKQKSQKPKKHCMRWAENYAFC